MTLPPRTKNKPWVSRKNHDKDKNLLWKTMEGNGTLRVRVTVRVKFLLFYSELTPTDPWYNMLHDFI